MQTFLHTQLAIWTEDPISVVTPLLQSDNQCQQLILLHSAEHDPQHIRRFLQQLQIELITYPLEQLSQVLPQLNKYNIQKVNVTQGNTCQKDQIICWARESDIPCYWIDTSNDCYAFLAPDNSPPIAIVDKLTIEAYLALKGIRVNELQRQPENFTDWLSIANLWVNNLSRYAKGFRALNHLAQTADSQSHISAPLSLALQNNLALQLLLKELEQRNVIRIQANCIHFASAEAKRFCNGIWLEYYALGQLKKLQQQRNDVQDLAMSVKLERGELNQPLRNEIDVMALINNRLYIIECKTGVLESEQSQLALYRLDAIADLLGQLTQGALLSFDQISPLIKRRAHELEVKVLDHRNMVQLFNTISQLAQQYQTPATVDSNEIPQDLIH